MKKKKIEYAFDFNEDKEYFIYLYACGRKLRKKKLAVIGENKYRTYEAVSYTHLTLPTIA